MQTFSRNVFEWDQTTQYNLVGTHEVYLMGLRMIGTGIWEDIENIHKYIHTYRQTETDRQTDGLVDRQTDEQRDRHIADYIR